RVFADRRRSTDCGNGGNVMQVLTIVEAPWCMALPRSLCQVRNTRRQDVRQTSLLFAEPLCQERQ
ncbi:MAG: hypothetical protein ACRDAJ_01910, partial [Serratia fonticola]